MDCHVAALLTKMAGGSVQGMFLGSRVKTPFYMAHRVMASERPASSMQALIVDHSGRLADIVFFRLYFYSLNTYALGLLIAC